MQILVSDSSVLIEFSKRDLLDRMFDLRFQFAVPDLLFNEELIDLGRYDRQDLLRLGLRVEALDPEGVATAIPYQRRRRAPAWWTVLPWPWPITGGTRWLRKTGA